MTVDVMAQLAIGQQFADAAATGPLLIGILAAAAAGRSLFGEMVVRSTAGAVLGTGSVVIGGTGATVADAPAQGAAPAPTTGTAPAAPVEDLVVPARSKGETRGVSPAGAE